MIFSDNTHLHCLGIGGIGVSAVARYFKAKGMEVTGSDIRESVVTAELKAMGIPVHIGHAAGNVPSAATLVVHTEDVNETSPGYVELERARELDIPTMTYSQMIGLIMKGMKGVGVTGTNGKSTTTAMLGLIAEKAKADPTVIVGSRVPKLPGSSFQSNARIGGSDLFIVEADEYHRHMLDAKPWGIVITNIEADHLDYYKNLDDIKSAFAAYVQALPQDGVVVYNSEDKNAAELLASAGVKKVSFGFSEGANLAVRNWRVENRVQKFELVHEGASLGEFTLQVPGRHNLLNAMGACLMALQLGFNTSAIRESLAEFPGIWRRFEIVSAGNGRVVVSDYAHHPDGIEKTLEAAKQFYPDAKILTVFQPHQKSRTKSLYPEFVKVLQKCEGLILTEIFSVVGREKTDIQISSKSMIADLQGNIPDLAFARDLDEAEKLINERLGGYGLVLFMGAGDIDKLARKISL